MPCSRIRIFSAIVSSLLIASFTHAQEAAPFAFTVPGGGNPFRAMIVEQVESELNCAKLVAELADDQADQILENLDELIDEQAEKLGEAIQGGNPMAAVGTMSSWSSAVLVEAKKILPEKAFKAYEADVTLRTKFERRGAQRAFLSAMDGYLQLNNKQQGAIAKILMSSWKDGWNQLGQIGTAAAGLFMLREPIKELPQEELKAAMSESQWTALEGILNLEMTVMADQVGFAKLQGGASSMLKLEEMTELCALSEAQSTKLQKAIDTSLTESIERKNEAMQAIQAGNFQGNMKAIQDIGRPIQQMMFKSDSWTEAIDEVLTKEQSAKYATRRKSRDKQNSAAMVSAMATTLAQQAGGMTGKQQISLAKLFQKEFGDDLTKDPMAISMKLADIPDAKYKEIVNDQQWGKMSMMLNAMKQQFDGGDGVLVIEEPVANPFGN